MTVRVEKSGNGYMVYSSDGHEKGPFGDQATALAMAEALERGQWIATAEYQRFVDGLVRAARISAG